MAALITVISTCRQELGHDCSHSTAPTTPGLFSETSAPFYDRIAEVLPSGTTRQAVPKAGLTKRVISSVATGRPICACARSSSTVYR